MGHFDTFPTVTFHCERQRTIAHLLKRLMDFSFAIVALLAMTPLMAFLAVLICLDSPGPIFYVSERVGRWGYPFSCFKFRTMVKDADLLKDSLVGMNERDSVLFKLSNDPRVTRLGRFLRRHSLDELPQLLNILRGDMSFVGPRPPLAEEVAMYEPEHFIRLAVLPGLTGLWQVEARRNPSFANYISLDTEYVRKWTLWMDIKIIFRTAGAVLRGTGA